MRPILVLLDVRPEDYPVLEPWARFWQIWVSTAFFNAYLSVTRDAPFLPQNVDDLYVLLDAYIIQKSVYELGYELNNRPGWVGIPLDGMRQILEAE